MTEFIRFITVAWYPVSFYTVMIFVFSSEARPMPSAMHFPHADKLFHFVEYGIWGLLWARAWLKTIPHLTIGQLWVLLSLGALIVGAFDEGYQFLVPGKVSSLLDLGADYVGACLWGTFFGMLHHRALAKRYARPIVAETP